MVLAGMTVRGPQAALMIAALSAAMSLTGVARAQDVDEGKRIATTWCINCHVVDPKGQTTGSDAVPTFRSVARRSSTTEMSLTAFLTTPHSRMPDFRLGRSEIADVTAYILSLRNSP